MDIINKREAKTLAKGSLQITRYERVTDFSNHTSVQDLDVTYDLMIEDLPRNPRLWFAERVSPTLLRISYKGTWFDCTLEPKEEEPK